MKTSFRQLFLGAAIACFFTLTFVALAQEPPAPAPAPAAPAAPSAAPASAPDAGPAAVTPSDDKKEPELRRLDASPATPAAPHRSIGSRIRGPRITHSNGNELVSVAHDSFLAKDQKADAVVSVFGSSTSEGEVADAVVSILGDTRMTGSAGGAAVAVLGNTYVDGKVGGEVVAVLGDVELGPNAEVGGEVVSVGGTVKRDPKAITHGNVQNVAIGHGFTHPHLEGFRTWFRECLLLGRPLAFSRGLGWAWTFAIAFFVVYALIALVFPRGVDKCVTTLETRPGTSILAAILSVLLTPVLVVLLCVTIIGIAALPFLALGLLAAGLVGKTVMLAWVGRRFTVSFGNGALHQPIIAVLIGGIVVLLLYCVPVVGMLVQKSFDMLGYGVVIYTLILANRREKPTPPPRAAVAPTSTPTPTPVVPPAPPAMPMASPGFGAMGVVASEPAPIGAAALPSVAPVEPPPFAAAAIPPVVPTPLAPPVISAAVNERAGFFIRLAALVLDLVLLGILMGLVFHGRGEIFPLIVAAYAAVMWKFRGTTIGGIVCSLKVVRIDGREIDWATAIVRSLSCFLSFVVVGLGFLWVAIDEDKQSWHDKIAGTTVVRVPKGVSLL